MKQSKKGKLKSAAQPKSAAKTVDAYVAGIPAAARSTFDKLRAAIRSSVPAEATETISYQIPAMGRKTILVWFAAFSDHCSLFPTAAVIGAFKEELKGFVTSKGTIQFPIDRPLPVALIKRIVKARVAQSENAK